MAITKTYLNGSFTALKSFLESLNLFDSVTLDDDSSPTSCTCKDADNHTLLTIFRSGTTTLTFSVRAYYNATDFTTAAYGNSARFVYGWACSNGCMINFEPEGTGSWRKSQLLITKSNNGKVVCVYSVAQISQTSDSNSCFLNIYANSWGDSAPYSSVALCANGSPGNQTMIVPFFTGGSYGIPSYTPKAGWMPVGQYYGVGFGHISMNDKDYLTNGFWAIEHEEEAAS